MANTPISTTQYGKYISLQNMSGSDPNTVTELGAIFLSGALGSEFLRTHATASLPGLTFTTGSVTVNRVLDEDAMGSNSASALATQQSIKAYVDAQVSGLDIDSFADGTGATLADTDKLLFSDAGTEKKANMSQIATYVYGETAAAITAGTVDATTDFTIDGLVITADTITNDAALSIVSTGLTLNASLDIALSADGGNVTMDDGTTTVFDFNTDVPELKIMDDAQVANYCSLAVGANGATTLTTVDADAAAANLIITADGTVDIDSAGAMTLDSGAAINLEPAAGSAILLDSTISIDAGVVTGATSITSTAFVGDLTGDVTGNASGTALTVTQAAQTAITSVGTLTALQVDNLNANGNTLSATSGAITLTAAAGSAVAVEGVSFDGGVVTGASSVTSTAFVGDLTGDVTGTSSKATVTDSTADTNFPVVFNNESDGLLDDTGTLHYNPSTGLLTAPALSIAGDLTVLGTQTAVNSTQLNIEDKKVRLGVPGGMTVDGDATYTLTSNVVTVTNSSHGFNNSEYVYISDPADSITEGVYQISSVADVNTFTFAFTASNVGSATAINHAINNVTAATGDGGGIFVSVASTTPTGIEWDSTNGWQILGGDLDLAASKNLSFAGTSILADSGGTLTLSNVDALDATTEATIESAIDTLANLTAATSLVTVGALGAGSIAAGFGAIDNGTSNITTGGKMLIDVDGSAINAAGALTFGAGNDAAVYFNGTDLVLDAPSGAGHSIRVAGTEVAIWEASGLSLAAGDAYSINDTSVLNATTLGSAVVASSLTSVGALNGGTITSGFGAIDNGSSTLDCGALTAAAADVTSLSCGGNATVGDDGAGADFTARAVTSSQYMFWDASGNSNKGALGFGKTPAAGYIIDCKASDGDIRADAFVTYSDERLKTNINAIANPMDKLQKLCGVSYDMKADGRHDIGFIAQDVQKVIPEVVRDSGDTMGIDYSRLTALLVEAVKSQQVEISTLKDAISQLKK